jgi:hypothetical protein
MQPTTENTRMASLICVKIVAGIGLRRKEPSASSAWLRQEKILRCAMNTMDDKSLLRVLVEHSGKLVESVSVQVVNALGEQRDDGVGAIQFPSGGRFRLGTSSTKP